MEPVPRLGEVSVLNNLLTWPYTCLRVLADEKRNRGPGDNSKESGHRRRTVTIRWHRDTACSLITNSSGQLGLVSLLAEESNYDRSNGSRTVYIVLYILFY